MVDNVFIVPNFPRPQRQCDVMHICAALVQIALRERQWTSSDGERAYAVTSEPVFLPQPDSTEECIQKKTLRIYRCDNSSNSDGHVQEIPAGFKNSRPRRRRSLQQLSTSPEFGLVPPNGPRQSRPARLVNRSRSDVATVLAGVSRRRARSMSNGLGSNSIANDSPRREFSGLVRHRR